MIHERHSRRRMLQISAYTIVDVMTGEQKIQLRPNLAP